MNLKLDDQGQNHAREIPKHRCCAHKLNVAMKRAIHDCEYVDKTLDNLSKFVSNTQKSIHRQNLHKEKKAKLHRQNFTRWSRTLMILYSFYKSYKKGLFNQ